MTRWRRIAMAVCLLAVLRGVGWWMQEHPSGWSLPPRAWSAQPGAGSSGRGQMFETDAARRDLQSFVGGGDPRVSGTPAAEAARNRLVGLFTQAGGVVERHATRIERRAGAVDLENLTVRIPGRNSGNPRVAVVAHSDSAPGAPGASDDGAGVVVALGITRALLAEPPEGDVLILITDGEERGLLGAQAFMAQHPLAQTLQAVVNMDARGASGPAFIFETGRQSAWLAELIAAHVPSARSNSLFGVVYGAMPNGTDFTVFLKAGMTGFNIAFIGDVAAYHTALDTVDRQSVASLQHMGTNALALVRALDQELPSGTAGLQAIPSDRAVFGDVLGLVLLRWPEPWTLGIVIASAMTFAGVVMWSALRTRMHWSTPQMGVRAPGRGAAFTLLTTLVVLAITALIGWVFALCAHGSGITMVNGALRLQLLNEVLFVAAVVTALGAGVFLLRKGVDPWSGVLGVWAPWFALAGVAAVVLPGASFLLVVPVVTLSLTACAMFIVRRSARSQAQSGAYFIAIAGLLSAAVIWMPLEPAFLDALGFPWGFQLGWLNGLRAGMVSSSLIAVVISGSTAASQVMRAPEE